MGYKVGDEVMVKAVINDICVGEVHPNEIKAADNPRCGSSARVIYVREEDVLPVPDMTAEEAWEIARKIVLLEDEGGIPIKDMVHIFGTKFTREIIKEYSEHETKAKIKAWEAEKEIKVGDVVKDCNGKIGVVISKGTSDNVLFDDGSTWNYTDRTLKKTGRHIDIEGLLKQIGGIE